MEIQLYFIRDPWIQEMKQSILFRLCRQRQEKRFVDLICFPYVAVMDWKQLLQTLSNGLF